MSRPLPELVLFLDECLGAADVAHALRDRGIQAEILLDHFGSGTRDEVWLPEVGRRGWTVLTKDKWIRRRALEPRALLEAGVAAFVLTAGDLTGTEMASAFTNAYPRMQKMVRDYEPPFIASVDAGGRVKVLTPARRRAAKKKNGKHD